MQTWSTKEQGDYYDVTTVASLLQQVEHIDEDFLCGYFSLSATDKDILLDALTDTQFIQFSELQEQLFEEEQEGST